jgi:DnaJ-class molecular chaperone
MAHRHPDKVPDGRKAEAEERFKRINAACAKLTKEDDSDDEDYESESEGMAAAYDFFNFVFGRGPGRFRGRSGGPGFGGPGIFMNVGGGRSSFVFMSSPFGGGGSPFGGAYGGLRCGDVVTRQNPCLLQPHHGGACSLSSSRGAWACADRARYAR